MLLLDKTESIRFFEKAKTLMPGGVNSPVRAARSLDIVPLVVDKAQGAHIWDVDGQSYMDYCMSWGALILGHGDPRVKKAVIDQLERGISYGALCKEEIELASSLVTHLPHLEKVRFVSSGTEATMSALRLARGYTGRNLIIKFAGNYHGHHDALLKEAGSYLADQGVPSSLGVTRQAIADTVVLEYNDPETFNRCGSIMDQIAAIIFEPVCGNVGVILPNRQFLDAMETFAQESGCLIIVDEVMTGFRSNLKGATADFKIRGDLYCYGKIIGGGLPAAFFGGKASIMDCLAPCGDVFQAGTLSGNPLAMKAGLSVIKALLEPSFYPDLHQKVNAFFLPIERKIKSLSYPVTLNRYGSMFSFFFGIGQVNQVSDLSAANKEIFKKFYHTLYESGIYLSPSAFEASFISSAHTVEALQKTQEVIIGFLETL